MFEFIHEQQELYKWTKNHQIISHDSVSSIQEQWWNHIFRLKNFWKN